MNIIHDAFYAFLCHLRLISISTLTLGCLTSMSTEITPNSNNDNKTSEDCQTVQELITCAS